MRGLIALNVPPSGSHSDVFPALQPALFQAGKSRTEDGDGGGVGWRWGRTAQDRVQELSDCKDWVQSAGWGPGQHWMGVSKGALLSGVWLAVLGEGLPVSLGWGLDPVGDFGVRNGMGMVMVSGIYKSGASEDQEKDQRIRMVPCRVGGGDLGSQEEMWGNQGWGPQDLGVTLEGIVGMWKAH